MNRLTPQIKHIVREWANDFITGERTGNEDLQCRAIERNVDALLALGIPLDDIFHYFDLAWRYGRMMDGGAA